MTNGISPKLFKGNPPRVLNEAIAISQRTPARIQVLLDRYDRSRHETRRKAWWVQQFVPEKSCMQRTPPIGGVPQIKNLVESLCYGLAVIQTLQFDGDLVTDCDHLVQIATVPSMVGSR